MSRRHPGDSIDRLRRQMIGGLLIALTAFVLFELFRGQSYGNKMRGEGDLWNYGSSLLLFLVSEIAVVNAIASGRLRGLRSDGRQSWTRTMWVLAALGFAFLACDEMLGIHEKIGLALEASIPWVGARFAERGDSLVMAGLAMCALAFSVLFLRSRAIPRGARAYFAAALAMSASAAVLDMAPHGISGFTSLIIAEELLEIYASALFASSFLTATMDLIGRAVLDLAARTSTRLIVPSPSPETDSPSAAPR